MKIKCPQCQQETVYQESNPHRPFCSERCKVFDTAAWAEESYTIPVNPDAPMEY